MFDGNVKYAVLYKNARTFQLIDSEKLQDEEPAALLRFFESSVVMNGHEGGDGGGIGHDVVGNHRPRILGKDFFLQ